MKRELFRRKSFIKILALLVCLEILAIAILGNFNGVKSSDTTGNAMIFLEKYSYNEKNGILIVSLCVNANTKLKEFDVTFGFSNDIEIIPYMEGSTDYFNILQNSDFNTTEPSIENNSIRFIWNYTGENEKGKETTEIDTICDIKFRLKTPVLEEDLSNNLFTINNYYIKNGDDNEYESGDGVNNIVKINPMGKMIDSIQIENAVFDKEEYKHGEEISLISGIAIINYLNATNNKKIIDLSTNREMKKDVNGKYIKDENGNYVKDEDGIIVNIEKGPWEADFNEKQIQISYKNKKHLIDVNVVDYIENIRFQEPNKKIYEYGQNLDISDSKAFIKMASKEIEEEKTLQELINNGYATISGFDSSAEEIKSSTVTQTVYVNIKYPDYEPFTENFNVTINDKIQTIEFQAPEKREYEYNEDGPELADGKIIIHMISGDTIERNLRNINKVGSTDILKSIREAINVKDEIEITGFDSTQFGEQTITVKYYYEDAGVKKNKTFTYPITIKEGIESIELSNDKITIDYGHEIAENDLSEYKIIMTTTNPDRTPIEIPVTPEMITAYDNEDISGEQTVAIQYNYKGEPANANIDIPFYITVKNYLDHIDLSKNNVKITCGTELDEDILTEEYKIIPVMANGDKGTEEQLIKDYIEGTYNINEEGNYEVKVKYLEKETDFTITVEDSITGIRLDDDEKEKIKKNYLYNENLELNDAKLTIVKASGKTEKIDLTKDMIKNYNAEECTTQSLNIEYKNMTIEDAFEVTVDNYLDHIELTKDSVKVIVNTELDENTLTEEYKIIAVMANGDKEEEVQLTKEKIVGDYDTSTEGEYKVNVEHEGKDAEFTIIVEDPVLEIKLEDDEKEKIKTEYLYNKELELNKAKLTIIKQSGRTEKIDLTKEMVQNYNSKEIGVQKLDIKYKGKEIKEAFEVKVKDYIVDIVLVNPNKTTYAPNEKLDLTGATVRTLSASGKLGDEVPVTFDMISGYIEGELGTQKITVKYEGFEKTFDAVFAAQTGMSNMNVYKILLGTILISVFTIVAILTTEKIKKTNY